MVYEAAIVLRAEIDETAFEAFKGLVSEVIKEFGGEILLTDDWGARIFSQPNKRGNRRGRYVYFIYSCEDGKVIKELERRFKINEDCLNSLIIKKEISAEKMLKDYKNPFTGQVDAEGRSDRDVEKDRKRFARRKTCWFKANKVEPDWKYQTTYRWLINEFGKISPKRITGLSSKYQRKATTEIKRARNIGMMGYMTNNPTA
ncbi:MAG: 30S ribosomal protein S18 [Bacteriovoracaceae bacterium]|jgi:small subunit ribosomal protein S6|nr:30S ribosomal protein S18 [Bacteriovoracaceae bacterium]